MKLSRTLPVVLGLCGVVALFAQNRQKETPSWAPKKIAKTVWTAPHKPHTKISEVRTQHAGQKEWRHLVVDDDHFTAAYVQNVEPYAIFLTMIIFLAVRPYGLFGSAAAVIEI